MDKITSTIDKSPQETRNRKLLDQLNKLTGVEFSGDFSLQVANKINDVVLTGRRNVNAEEEDSPIHCNAEWHFARYTGPGSTLVPLLYGCSFHLAGASGNFYLSIEKLARFLNLKKSDNLYAAANLLATDGFLQEIERENGKPVKYRPVRHETWALEHPNRCTKKLEIEYLQDGDEELKKLGRNLGAILGGEKFHKQILLGIQNAAPEGSTDEEICAHAKNFLALDKGKGSGKARRVRFFEYLRNLEE